MTHLNMDKLSGREKKMVKQLLKQAYDEGGRKLEFVMRKLILTIYWAHFSTIWTDDWGTVYHTLCEILSRQGNTLKEKITRELYSWVFDTMGQDYRIDGDTILQDPGYVYKGISITHITNTDIKSLKPFMDALRNLIDTGKVNRETFKKLGISYAQPAVDCELPF